METIVMVLIAACLIVGVFFAFVGVLGVLKMKDFFARTQASTCITTMGVIGAVLAGIIYCVYNGMSFIWIVKMIMIAWMIFLSSAVSGHSLSKGTYRRGHRPHDGGFVINDYEEDGYNEDGYINE